MLVITEQWVKQMLADYDLQYLNKEDATGLAHHINSLQKRAKKGQSSSKKFIPIERFIDDGINRFIETKINQRPSLLCKTITLFL